MKMVSEEKIIEIINDKLKKPLISIEQKNADLLELGLDSIIFISVIVALEEEFGMEFPDEKLTLTEMNTVTKIAEVISSVC